MFFDSKLGTGNYSLKNQVRFWLGILFSIGCMILVLVNQSWGEFLRSMRNVNGYYVALSIAMMAINLIIRAKRWQLLIKPIASVHLIKDSFTCYAIGYMANMILPLKPGEIIRPYLLGRIREIPKAPLFATVLIERLWDIIFLTIFFLITLHVSDARIPPLVRRPIFSLGAIAALVMFVLWVLTIKPGLQNRLSSISRWVPKTINDRIRLLLDYSIPGMKTLIQPRSSLSILCLTGGIYISSMVMIHLCLSAFHLELSWYVSIFAVIIANFGMILPSSPSAAGVAHALYVYSFTLFGVGAGEALGVSLIGHGVGFVTVVASGFISLWVLRINFRSFTELKKIKTVDISNSDVVMRNK